MSINKLKLNSKKKDQSKSSLSKQQKLKQLNGEIMDSLNRQQHNNNIINKSGQKKQSLINMISGPYQAMDHNFFSVNKNNIFQGSLTERTRRFQKNQYPITYLNPKTSKIQFSNDQQNNKNQEQSQQNSSSASQLLDSLNLQIQKQGKINQQIQRYKKKPTIKTINLNQNGINQSTKSKNQKINENNICIKQQEHKIKIIQSQVNTNQVNKNQDIKNQVIKNQVITNQVNKNQVNKNQDIKNYQEQYQYNNQETKQIILEKQNKETINKQIQIQKNHEQVKEILTVNSGMKVIQKAVLTQLSTQNNNIAQNPSNKITYKPINQVQLLVLQQNQVLTKKIQQIRKQRDNLLFSNKRFEIQLMQANNNDYYQRQNNRLGKQVQNVQSINEQIKHNNFILQNKTKQLESSDELNKRELKRILKQFQQLRLQSARERFESKQKIKTLQQLIKTLQQHNKQLSNKFQNSYNKNQQQQKIIKIKTQQQNKLKKILDSYQSKLINLQKVNNEKRKIYQQQIYKYNKSNSDLVNNYRNIKRQSETEIQNLKQNVKQLTLKRQSEVLLLQSRTKFLQKHNNSIQAELQVVRLQQTVKQLKQQVQKRTSLIKQLNIQIDSMISMNDYEQLRKQFENMNYNHLNQKKQYQNKILVLGEQVNLLRQKINQKDKKINQLSINQTNTNIIENKNNPSNNNFKQILKQQIIQYDNLKQQIFKKNQLIFTQKQQFQQLNIKYSSLRNQHQIVKKQHNSLQNNSKIKKQILEQQLLNQIQSFKRKLQVLQKKYQSKIKQNKQKQTFITNYIIGKSTANVDANYLLKQLQRVFLEKQKQNLTQNNL